MRKSGWFGVVFGILVAGGLGVAGYSVYQAGYRQGLLENAGDVVVHANGFYPPFGIFFGLIFLLFFLSFIGRAMFGWRRWGAGPRWGYHGNGEAHPMEARLQEWHDQAHSPGRTHGRDSGDTTGSNQQE